MSAKGGKRTLPILLGSVAVAALLAGAVIWYIDRNTPTADPTQTATAPTVPEVAEPDKTIAAPEPTVELAVDPEATAPLEETAPKVAALEPEPAEDREPQSAQAPQTEVEPSAPAEPEPEEVAGQEPADKDVATTDTTEVAAPPAPQLDEVRLESDGLAVIAGRAQPFAEVILFADQSEIGRVKADSAGAFATLAFLSTSDKAQALTVAEVDADGTQTLSDDAVILAPVDVTPPSPEVQDQLAMVAPQVDPVPGLAETGKLAQTEPTTSRPTASTPAATEAPQPDTANTLALPEGSSPTGPTAEDTAAPTLTTPEVNLTDDTKITKLDTETPQAPQPRKFAVLKSDSSGVRVLAPSGPAPDVAKQIALDSISYSVAGDVQLQGRAQSKAREVRVYLDNTPIAALEVDDSGAWRGALPDVDTGVFTLRIDEIDDSGNVSSRVETPFKREDPAVLQAVNEQTDDLVKAVTVQKGNTLWAIARERYGEGVLYVRVFEANRDQIRNPDLIYPGQVFAIPQK